MTVSGSDPRALVAAKQIHDAYTSLSDAGRRVADDQLRDYPAQASDPRLAGPVLAAVGVGRRRAAQLLAAAGGSDLQDAAERLAGWTGPVVTLTDLRLRLEAWLPDGVSSAALTRRMLCDAAGLATTPWSAHAVSVAALEAFARTAMDHADDAELIAEEALALACAQRGWDDSVIEALGEACGFERLFGHLVARRNRVSLSKAALLDRPGGASRHDIAELTGLTPEEAGLALTTCDSIVRVGYGRWAAHRDPQFALFAAAVAQLADDVGLIDEPRLQVLAAHRGWADRLDDWITYAGYFDLNNQLAMSDTNRAKLKAALIDLGDGAPIEEVAEAAGLSVKAASLAARNTESVHLFQGLCQTVTAPRLSLVELARANADDVGVVNVDCFAADAATHSYEGTADELAEQCGLIPLFGSFALRASTAAAVKAALLHLQRPAAVAELATMTDRTPKAVTHALIETSSIVAVGRRWTINTVDGALGEFAAAAANAADDVGLINEPDLRAVAAERGWTERIEELIKGCGLERLAGRLALDRTQRAILKAALRNLGRPATSHELAAAVGMTPTAVTNVLAATASVTRIRPSVWVPTDLADGAYTRFGAALRLCSDDVGLINEAQLREIAQLQHWEVPVGELIDSCGLPRLHGTLAMADTAPATAKAALLELGRPATLYELAEITGHRYGTLRNALARVPSVNWVSRRARGERGLLTITDAKTPSR